MTGPTPQERYHLVAPLPPMGGWRRMLALDRRGSPSGPPVVLSFAPAAVVEDAARLAALSRDAEAGARVHHPNVLPVLGLETVDDQLALAEPYRAGTALSTLLETSGRLPVELAIRVACDVAAGLAALHGLDVGDGQPLAHGALGPDRILVGEDGTSLVCGVGTGAGRSPADDIRALALLVAEMVSGELPEGTGPFLAAGIPPVVAAVIDRARGLGGAPIDGAAAFAAALAGAHPPADAAAVSVYVGAAGPTPSAAPEAPAAPVIPAAGAPHPPPVPDGEVSAELIAPGTAAPEVSAELVAPGRFGAPAAPAAERTPPDAAITFRAPGLAAPVRRIPRVPTLLAVLVLGLALGFGLARVALGRRTPASPPAPAVETAPEPDEALPPPAAAETAAPPAPPPPAREAKASPPAAPARAVTPAPSPEPVRKKPSISVTAVPGGEILVDGKLAGRAPVLVEVRAGEHEVRLRDRAEHVDVRQRVTVKAPATPVKFQLVRGKLEVTAPADTEVWVDGRKVGMGDRTVDLWEGWHEVEARRGGSAVKERFELTAIVTKWTYNVTPTP